MPTRRNGRANPPFSRRHKQRIPRFAIRADVWSRRRRARKSSRIWWRSHNTAIGIGFTSRARKNFGDRSGLRPVKRGSRYGATSQTIAIRSEEHTSELQSLMRISYAVFCLKKKKKQQENKD